MYFFSHSSNARMKWGSKKNATEMKIKSIFTNLLAQQSGVQSCPHYLVCWHRCRVSEGRARENLWDLLNKYRIMQSVNGKKMMIYCKYCINLKIKIKINKNDVIRDNNSRHISKDVPISHAQRRHLPIP